MSQENKALARRAFDEIFSKGNLAVADEVFDAGYVGHDPASPTSARGPAFVKQDATTYRTAFPDLQVTIHEQIAEGDRVVTRWSARGTHRGELMGIAPTGKQMAITGITISRIASGKVVEGWDNWDTLGMMQQLGVIPQMAAATG